MAFWFSVLNYAEDFLNLGFYCLSVLFIAKMLTCLKRFNRYGHYTVTWEVEDSHN